MALSQSSSSLSSKSLFKSFPCSSSSCTNQHQSHLSLLPSTNLKSKPITAVHAAEPAKSVTKTASSPVAPSKWSIESWKSKKALQLPEYPNEASLAAVLKTLEDFPPIVFAGEARHLEERLADAAVGKAFLLQGGDCAESFKEFKTDNIRDTFRLLLQMSVVLMFGGQMPVIKVYIPTQFKCSHFYIFELYFNQLD